MCETPKARDWRLGMPTPRQLDRWGVEGLARSVGRAAHVGCAAHKQRLGSRGWGRIFVHVRRGPLVTEVRGPPCSASPCSPLCPTTHNCATVAAREGCHGVVLDEYELLCCMWVRMGASVWVGACVCGSVGLRLRARRRPANACQRDVLLELEYAKATARETCL